MNCVHYRVGVQIWEIDAKLLKTSNNNITSSLSNNAAITNLKDDDPSDESSELETEQQSDSVIIAAVRKALQHLGNWNCVECGSTASPWLCLACGLIHCGRYVNQHSLRHYESKKDHSLCMDCYSYSVYCYQCDDFVSIDECDSKIKRVRASLQSYNTLRISDHSYFSPVSEPPRRRVGRRPKNVNRRNQTSVKNETPRKKRRLDDEKEEKFDASSALSSAKKRGLRNLGNTCFMNAVLQSLNNIDEFCQYFVKLPQINVKKCGKTAHYVTRNNSSNVTEDDVFLTEELRKMLVALSQNGNSAISPDSLFSVVWKLVPRFRGYQQQDAHEFLRCILDRLHCELLRLTTSANGNENSAAEVTSTNNNNNNNNNHNNNIFATTTTSTTTTSDCHHHYSNHMQTIMAAKPTRSVITNIFEGILESEVKCLLCQNLSKKYDPFLDLSLDIPADEIVTKKDRSISLDVCLSSFFAEEHLSETELYKCMSCRRKQPSSKQFFIRRLPNVLCLHLKRFRWSTYYRQKIDYFVEFPLRNLDMKPYLFKNGPATRGYANFSTLYDLAAIVVHHGSGTGSGHYTTYAQRDNSWHHFNDTAVRMCAEENVLKQKAYILFYVRRNFVVSDRNG